MNTNNLYDWCIDQARLYYQGKLEQYKIDKLNSIGFIWEYYKDMKKSTEE